MGVDLKEVIDFRNITFMPTPEYILSPSWGCQLLVHSFVCVCMCVLWVLANMQMNDGCSLYYVYVGTV